MTDTGQKNQTKKRKRGVLELYSPRMSSMFASYLDGYFARNFDGVRVHETSTRDWNPDTSMVFFCNHGSWWDPIFIMLLAAHMTPGRPAFGPMEEVMLQKYGFMRRIGLYGVDTGSMRGAAKFLSASKAILERGDTAIWLTPQGRFCDVRQRPLDFQPGVARLARDIPALFVPMAVEYVFWNERKAEALVRFGEPIEGASVEGRTTEEWNKVLEAALEANMDVLAEAAQSRDPERFTTLIKGRARINPVYDAWRYAKALFRRQKFSAAHEDERE